MSSNRFYFQKFFLNNDATAILMGSRVAEKFQSPRRSYLQPCPEYSHVYVQFGTHVNVQFSQSKSSARIFTILKNSSKIIFLSSATLKSRNSNQPHPYFIFFLEWVAEVEECSVVEVDHPHPLHAQQRHHRHHLLLQLVIF